MSMMNVFSKMVECEQSSDCELKCNTICWNDTIIAICIFFMCYYYMLYNFEKVFFYIRFVVVVGAFSLSEISVRNTECDKALENWMK